MIDTTELRIGNLISWNPRLTNENATLPPMTVKASAILQDKIGYTSPNYEHRVEPFEDDKLQMEINYKPLAELEPIAITKEILDDGGFKKKSGSVVKHKSYDLYLDTKKRSAYYIKKKVAFENILYVHQLQNLYYTLTGNELEISI